MSTSGVYGIFCIENARCYVGSSRNIEHRWGDHRRELASGKHHNQHLQRGWNKYGADKFSFHILEKVDFTQQYKREMFWINFLGATYNHAKPNLKMDGWIFEKRTPEQRERIAASHRGLKYSEAHRLHTSEALKRRPPPSDETRKKLSESQKRKPPSSPESRRRQAEKIRGRKASAETREKLSKAGKGRKKSQEWSRKIGEANLGKKRPPEAVKRTADALRGKPWTALRRLASLFSKQERLLRKLEMR